MPVEAHRRARAVTTAVNSVGDAPPPPNSAGTHRPSSPDAASAATLSAGHRPSASQACRSSTSPATVSAVASQVFSAGVIVVALLRE